IIQSRQYCQEKHSLFSHLNSPMTEKKMVSEKNLKIAKVLVILSAPLILVLATAGFGRAAVFSIPVSTSRGLLTAAAVKHSSGTFNEASCDLGAYIRLSMSASS